MELLRLEKESEHTAVEADRKSTSPDLSQDSSFLSARTPPRSTESKFFQDTCGAFGKNVKNTPSFKRDPAREESSAKVVVEVDEKGRSCSMIDQSKSSVQALTPLSRERRAQR